MHHLEPTSSARSDSVIESRLSREQAQTFFDEIEAGLPMKAAVDYLREKHNIALSAASISRWCSRRRRWVVDDEFLEAINWSHVNLVRCEDLVEACASPEKLLEGNLILACQEFFNASLTSDRRRQRHAARMLTAVTNAAKVFRGRLDATGGLSTLLGGGKMEKALAAALGKTRQPEGDEPRQPPLRPENAEVS